MPKNLSSRDVDRILVHLGFELVRHRKESIYKGTIQDQIRVVVVPRNKKSIPKGTLSSIWRQAGLTKNDVERIISLL